MILGIANNSDANAQAMGDSSFGNGFGSVVRALGVNVRTKFLEQFFYIRFWKNQDIVDGAECADQLGTGLFVEDRAPAAFQVTKAGVCVHSDDEDVSFTFGAFEVANVANVERVEAAVGEYNALSCFLCFAEQGAKFVAGSDFGLGSAHELEIRLRRGAVNSFEQF